MATEVGKAFIGVEPSMTGFAAKLRGGLASQTGSGGILGKAGKTGGLAFMAGFTGTAVAAGYLGKLGGEFHSAYAKIRVDTGATGKTLDGLQGSFKNVLKKTPASFDDVSTAIAGINKRLGLTGKPLETLSLQAIRLSRITKTDLKGNLDAVVPLLDQWGLKGDKAGATLDLLFRASQKSGVAVAQLAGDLSGAGVQLRAVGFDLSQSTALIALLGKEGLGVKDVVPAISRAMAKAAKDGKNAGQVFSDTFKGIKNAKSDTEAAGIALDVFGARAGPKLAALIRSGKLSWEDFQKSIAKGDTIEKAAKDTSTWQSKLGVLGNQLKVALEPIATRVFDSMGKAVVSATPALVLLAATLATVVGAISHVPGPVIATVGAVGVLGFAVKKISGPIKTLWSGLTMVAKGAKTVAVGLKNGVTAIAQWGKQAIVAAVNTGRQVAAFVAQKAAALGAAVAEKSMAAAQWLLNAAMDANPVGLLVVGIAALVAGVVLAYNHFGPFRDLVQAVGRAFVTAGKVIVGSVGAALSWVTGHWPLMLGILTGPIGLAVLFVRSNWSKITGVFSGTLGWVRSNWPTLFAILTGPIGLAVLLISKNWQTIKNGFGAVKNFIAGRVGEIVGFFTGLPAKITGAFGDASKLLRDIGGKIVGGLIDGIKNGLGPLGKVLGSVGGFIKDHKGPAATDAKLLTPIGGLIMDGLVTGIERGMPKLRTQLGKVSDEITRTPLAFGNPSSPKTIPRGRFGAFESNRPSNADLAAGMAFGKAVLTGKIPWPKGVPKPAGIALNSQRFVVARPTPVSVAPIARVAHEDLASLKAGWAPRPFTQENHFHGSELPTPVALDYAGRKAAFTLANTGERP